MLILVRGIPGSGKSTWVTKTLELLDHYVEADCYFVRADGVYDFNPKLLKNAHEWCYTIATDALAHGRKDCDVYVANTFTRIWEMQKYIDYCNQNDIPFKVVRCTGNYQNIHGVPDNKVKQMLERFEDYEGEEFV